MYYSPIGESYDRDRVADYRRHLTKTYALMALGLAVTFGAAIVTALFLPHLFVFNFYVSVALLVAEVVTVIAFSAMLPRAKVGTLIAMYFFYALLTGLSISYIFVLYDLGRVYLCFAAAALSFSIMALVGHTAKRDLSAFGHVFLAGIVGLVFLTIVGILIHSETIEIIISCVGLVLFLGITAFDAQRLRRFYESAGEDSQLTAKYAVYTALQFYLDFINIFFYLVRLLGRNRR
ncbi:MAG: Bax inhibitor-1/YccA family protein [Eubacteriales bacterium]